MSEIRDTQSQLKDVNKLLKLDPGNAELMAQKQRLLSQAVSETKEKLERQADQSAVALQKIGAAGTELEAREILEDDRRRQYGEALGIRDYIHLEEYDKSIMASLIASAQVMGEDRLEVTWKYQDVYEKILGEMQG